MIGNLTGKCVHYGIMSTDCRQCEVNEKGDNNESHDCRKNYSGSSKAMESALAVQMVRVTERKTRYFIGFSEYIALMKLNKLF